MIKIGKIKADTKCELCGHKETREINITVDLNRNERITQIENELNCTKCGFDLKNRDNLIYCCFEIWDENKEELLNYNYDKWVSPEECEKCPYFNICHCNLQKKYPKAFK